MNAEPGVYVARYGWNRRSGRPVILTLVFVLLIIVLPMPLAARVVTGVFFGGALLFFLGMIATRRVALRVDASGVTLGGYAMRYRSTTSLVPWADIKEITLWRQQMPRGRSMPYVGLTRREGAQSAGRRHGRRAGNMTAPALAPDVDGTATESRPVNLWQLDAQRLAASVAHFAPGIRVVDQDTGQVIGPAG